MIKKLFTLVICVTAAIGALAQKIQSPGEFLGYKLGSRYTLHYRIADYFNYVAQTAKNVKLVQFGSTNEGRPLMAMFIASAGNINRLEEIRQNNLAMAGMNNQKPATTDAPVIVWLSYNVHGNEPSSSEAAMQTLYDMVDPSNSRTQEWLKNTVVVIDPCLNPDGRDRYVNFFNQNSGATPNADPYSREHFEQWPGGRVNHYYFDLNRDWAWQTQKETQARLALFNQWLPQVHVDFHEQSYNSPYYFAPAAEPFHRDITGWQREFQTIIGKNNAKYFDQNGWMYFTKEEFDLLYPSYGDTYPIYNGSIGMTYEQGGGPGGGLAVVTESGDTLTLADRIAHHHSNGLSTVESASLNAKKALAEFKKYYDKALTAPPGGFNSYVIKNDNADKIQALAKLLDRNGIKYGFGLSKGLSGFNYFTGKNEQFNASAGDMLINAAQPKAVLLNVLIEPKTFVADSNTYDITAWSLPYVYGLKTYGLKESLSVSAATLPLENATTTANNKAYAYVAPWKSVKDVAFLADLLKQNVKVRYAETGFEAGGKWFSPGSLIITRAGNKRDDFDQLLTQAATKYQRTLVPLATGFVEKGADIGSRSYKFISKPHVVLFTGDGTSSSAVGEIWEYFEQQINYPVTLVRYQDIARIKWSDYDVAIFADGNYNNFPAEKINGWVRDGGKLIMLEGAISQLLDKKGFGIKKKEDQKDDKAEPAVKFYENRDREAIKYNIPGAIYKVTLDNTHPLGFGYPLYYYTLKVSSDIYDYLKNDGWNVGTVKKDGYVSGFVGEKSKAMVTNGTLLGVEPMGRGSVVYLADDPLFRSFWENGKLLFGNAVFMVQ